MLPVRSLHTVLLSEKWEECVSFYKDVLGFPVVYERERFVEFRVAAHAHIGILRPLRSNAPTPGHEDVILSICVDDIERTRAELEPRFPGLPAVTKHPWGPRVFEFRDPEGRRIEFWSP